jgi:membrane protein implicated in regulation of membrane protease activity
MGIILLIAEVFATGFFLFSIGVGAIVTGLIARMFPHTSVQIAVFVVTTLVTFILMKPFAKKLLKPVNKDTNIFALVDKTGIVTRIILPQKRGYVKIEGEEWSAISEDPEETILENSVVRIINTEGNKVIVKSTNKGE